MTQHLRRFAIAPIILAMAGPASAQIAQPQDCAAAIEAISQEWRSAWSRLPPLKPYHDGFMEDRHGHRYSINEIESMHRRLDRGRKLCQDGATEEAKTEMMIVRGWLDDDNALPVLK